MEEQELKNIWKNSSKTEDININTSQLGWKIENALFVEEIEEKLQEL